ncbi:hypothetical protein FRC06_001237, partial [Ceratobasidium sp. 370]
MHWNRHEGWQPGGQVSHDQPQPYEGAWMGYAEGDHTPPRYQPPGPDVSPQSLRTPITPTAGSNTGLDITRGSQQRRRRDSSVSDSKEKRWF